MSEQSGTHKFETERSHQAAQIAYDLSKATAQACLLINGGAATAVIAFLSKSDLDPTIYKIAPWSLGLYALGVIFSAAMLFCEMMNADYWNYLWHDRAYLKNLPAGQKWRRRANKWHRNFYVAFGITIACFLTASLVLSVGLSGTRPSLASLGGPSVQTANSFNECMLTEMRGQPASTFPIAARLCASKYPPPIAASPTPNNDQSTSQNKKQAIPCSPDDEWAAFRNECRKSK